MLPLAKFGTITIVFAHDHFSACLVGFTSDQLSMMDSSVVRRELLDPATIVRPTSQRWPLTSWLQACNLGLSGLSSSVGQFLHYNESYGVAAVGWASLSANNSVGFHRYSADGFDVCFSGEFQNHSVALLCLFFVPPAKLTIVSCASALERALKLVDHIMMTELCMT